jgi:phage regulator Rha-like protein
MSALVPIVHAKDGEVFANSRDVADFFGKQHYDVLDSIRETCIPSLSPEISGEWFIPVKNGQW